MFNLIKIVLKINPVHFVYVPFVNICINMEKKRKIDSECRTFKEQWGYKYFVIESSNKAMCIICNEIVSVLKDII